MDPLEASDHADPLPWAHKRLVGHTWDESGGREVPSLKLIAKAPEALGGWNTVLSFWGLRWPIFRGV